MPPKRKRAGDGTTADGAAGGTGGPGAGQDPPSNAASIPGTSAFMSAYYLKKPDGVALLRHDLQYDLLALLFNNVTYRFTPPNYPSPTTALFPTDRTWSFAELYLDAISNSSKANKSLKDKMSESTEYAVNFAKICLLINVGRINTTLAFYPEMRTLLRTYHPIPSMQIDEYTRKNLQDAPRMKSQLKGCFIPQEENDLPTSLAEVLRRANEMDWKPPTSIVQLIFLFYTEHALMTDTYFPEGFHLHEFFLPSDPSKAIPSEQRCEAFLYLIHRFLETPGLAAADFHQRLPAEQRLHLDRRDCSEENIDNPEETQFAAEMKSFRDAFVEKCKAEDANKAPGSAFGDDGTEDDRHGSGRGSGKGRGKGAAGAHLTPGGSSGDRGSASSNLKRIRSTTSQDPRLASPATYPHLTPLAGNGVLPNVSDLYVHLNESKGSVHYDLARLVANAQVTDSTLYSHWTEFTQLAPDAGKSTLPLAWAKVKKDIEAKKDPVYDSEEESEWTATELRPRTLGFTFTNYETGQRDTLQFEGTSVDVDPDLFPQYAARIANGLSDHRASAEIEGRHVSRDGSQPVLDQSEYNKVYNPNHAPSLPYTSNGSVSPSKATGTRMEGGDRQHEDDDEENDELEEDDQDIIGDVSAGLNSSAGEGDFSRLLQDDVAEGVFGKESPWSNVQSTQ